MSGVEVRIDVELAHRRLSVRQIESEAKLVSFDGDSVDIVCALVDRAAELIKQSIKDDAL